MSRRRGAGRIARLAAALASAVFAGAPAAADEIAADLSQHLIAITSSFTGTSVVLFGATDGPGDIIAVVRGPEREMTVWRKHRIAGIWANAESVEFRNVPSFYAVASSRPIEEALPPDAAALHRIGVENLGLETTAAMPPERRTLFTAALIRQQQRAGRFPVRVEPIEFVGERLFRADIAFPSSVPTGAYSVDVFLIRNRGVAGGQTTPLIVSKVGVDAAVFDFANGSAAAYGAIAVLVAVVAGWLASLPFRTA